MTFPQKLSTLFVEPRPITLRDFMQISRITHTHPTTETGAISFTGVDAGAALHRELWHLSDYRVVEHTGAVVWLLPIE